MRQQDQEGEEQEPVTELNEEQLTMLENQMIEAGLHEQFQQLSDQEKIQLFNQMIQGGFEEEGEEGDPYGEEAEADMDGYG